MSRHLDAVLEAIDDALAAVDVGHQVAGDVAYAYDNGLCVRCQHRPPAAGSSWCEWCSVDRPPPEVDAEALAAGFAAIMDLAVHVAEQFAQALELVCDQLASVVRFEADLAQLDEDLVGVGRQVDALGHERGPWTVHAVGRSLARSPPLPIMPVLDGVWRGVGGGE